MSVLVKGMKMPDCCNNCEFHWEEDVSCGIMHQCQIKTGYIDDADIHSFPYDCPLIELPEKHGRLIDADELIDYCNDMLRIISESDDDMINIITSRICYANVIGQIINMATILEAEGEG